MKLISSFELEIATTGRGDEATRRTLYGIRYTETLGGIAGSGRTRTRTWLCATGRGKDESDAADYDRVALTNSI